MNVFRRITSALKSNMEIFDALTNEVHFLFRICLENILGSWFEFNMFVCWIQFNLRVIETSRGFLSEFSGFFIIFYVGTSKNALHI